MASTHRDNVCSPASSLSGSSFSIFTFPPSADEAIDESSSDEDEIVWTANEFDPDDDFILIPQTHPRPEPVASKGTEADAPSLHKAFSKLSFHDTSATALTTPTTPTASPHKPKFKPRKPLGHKGRRSAGAPSTVSRQSLASTAPNLHRGRRRRGRKDVSASYPSPSPSPERDLAGNFSSSRKDPESINGRAIHFGECPFVEDSDGDCDPVTLTKYEEAVGFITSFLSNPSAALTSSTYTRLTLLQSLIIELGLMSPSSALPSSMRAAKHLLRTRAFINIGEYLSVREQGLDKLQQIMFSSKKELTSDLRRKKGGKKADKGWVKRHGLNVLLVTMF